MNANYTFNTHNLSDENALLLLREYAKIDPKAFKLFIDLKESKDFGDKDMNMSKIHRYILDNNPRD